MRLRGAATGEDDERGRPVLDRDFLLLLNAHYEAISSVVPASQTPWQLILDTTEQAPAKLLYQAHESCRLGARSLALLTAASTAAHPIGPRQPVL